MKIITIISSLLLTLNCFGQKTDNTIIIYPKLDNPELKAYLKDRYNVFIEHYNAMKLAESYIHTGDYCRALDYLNHAREFPPSFDCGNSYGEDNRDMKILYAYCYIGQGDYNKAIDSLSPNMFVNWFGNNSKLVQKLVEAYKLVYSTNEIKNEFAHTIETLIIEKTNQKTYTFYRPKITVFGRSVEIPASMWGYYSRDLTEEQLRQKITKSFLNSEIYKLVNF